MRGRRTQEHGIWTHLHETDGSRLLTEALTTEVKAVLADETSLVRAQTAEKLGQTGQI